MSIRGSIIRMLPLKAQIYFYNKGIGVIEDDDPSAQPAAYEVDLPDGTTHQIVIDPDGRIHGLPGSPPDGIPPGREAFEKWLEKMEAFRGWERKA